MDVGYEERVGAMGGVAWCGDMLGNDCGHTVMRLFLERVRRRPRRLRIVDSRTGGHVDVACDDCGDLPSALSRVCALAGSRTMHFVSEDAANGRVLVGVDVHGGVKCPGTYRYAGGRLLEVGI